MARHTTLRDINNHDNYNTSIFCFLVMKTSNFVETAFQKYKIVIRTIYMVIRIINIF